MFVKDDLNTFFVSNGRRMMVVNRSHVRSKFTIMNNR